MDCQGSQGNFQVGLESHQDIPESFQVDMEDLEVLEDLKDRKFRNVPDGLDVL